jgi:hypothetical protein
MNGDLEMKRKQHQERQKRALKVLEERNKQRARVQPTVARVEDGRRPGDRTTE